jgi:F-type H+-transporting ATPase subunit b
MNLRLIGFVLVLGVAVAAPVAARAADKDEPKKDEHAGAIYEAAYHDADGKHQHATFDLSKSTDKERLKELIEHGHVLEMENKAPTDLSKLFSLRADLGIWSLIVFGLLFFTLSKLAWPKMLSGLQRRESNIRGALDEAQKARDEAAALRAQFQKEMDGAHLKVKDILDDARRDASATTDDMIAKAKNEIGAERERARREIVVETDQALQTIWSKAADLATQVSAAALGKQLDVTMHRRLIDEALDDLKATSRN